MIKKYSKMIFTIATLSLLIFFMISCGSTSNVKNNSITSAYYENNINDFYESKLKNDIPVIFKKNSGSQIVVLKMLFEGGVPLISYDKSGVEKITMNLMLHGSKNYSYQKIQRLQYEKSFSIANGSSKDFSSITMSCIKRDFNEVLDVFADGINNPLFNEKDFVQEMKISEDSLKSQLNNPNGKLGIAITENVFKNHPYLTTNGVNNVSVKNINLVDIKRQYSNLLNANRIKIVIVGNFEAEEENEILLKLDEYFGLIDKSDYKTPKIPDIELDSTKVNVTCEQSGEIGYIEGVFKCPQRNDSDYIPYVLAAMYVDDSLFKIVREKNSAVYSIGTGIIGARKFVGAISVFKASKTEGIKEWIFESINDFPKSEREVKHKLDSYKNKYITSIFENSQNANGIASNISSSLIYRDSATEYLNRTAQVQSVTAKDVIAAYNKYFAPLTDNSSIKWIVVSDKKTVDKFDF